MLSACLHMTIDHRINILSRVSLIGKVQGNALGNFKQTVWLRSAKTSVDGEGLVDKGFDRTDRFFAHFNRVRCPKLLRQRDVKQHHAQELP